MASMPFLYPKSLDPSPGKAERLSKKQGRDFEDNSVNQQCALDEKRANEGS
jgi:hypothetical protein